MAPWYNLVGASLLALGALQLVAGHMQLYSPIPRADPRQPSYGEKDYNLSAPLNHASLGGPFPCKHQKAGPITGRYTAGQSFKVHFRAGASHMGGHCQFALSYDGGKNWVVLKTIIDLCFMGNAPWTYNIPLPKGAKNGNAVFAWTWINSEGNREYYMNCADVEIVGGSDNGSLTGPELFVAQMNGHPSIPQWARTDAKNDGKEHFNNRKVVTIPSGVQPTREGTVAGEACNGKPGANQPPAKIPWDRFVTGNVQDTGNNNQYFVATSQDAGPGVNGDSEASYPYQKGTALPDASAPSSTTDSTDTYEPSDAIESDSSRDKKGSNGKKISSYDEYVDPADTNDNGKKSDDRDYGSNNKNRGDNEYEDSGKKKSSHDKYVDPADTNDNGKKSDDRDYGSNNENRGDNEYEDSGKKESSHDKYVDPADTNDNDKKSNDRSYGSNNENRGDNEYEDSGKKKSSHGKYVDPADTNDNDRKSNDRSYGSNNGNGERGRS